MLTGTFANLIASDQPPAQRMPIIVAGVTFQGLGFMVSLLMYVVLECYTAFKACDKRLTFLTTSAIRSIFTALYPSVRH